MRVLLIDSPHRALIERAAQQHGLPAELVAAIVQVESGGDPCAVRYEPGFFDRYIVGSVPAAVRPCSRETEGRLRATSFGLLQVMGQVARERGFRGVYLTQLCDPVLGLEYGCRHLAWTAVRLSGKGITDYASLCAAYNGGLGAVLKPGSYRNPEYPAKVLAALGGSWEMTA